MQALMQRPSLRPSGLILPNLRQQLDSSCVRYLPLWNISGDVFLSQDAYGHTVTRTGATPTGQGGMLFDGNDDYLVVPTAPFVGLTNCTLVMWFVYMTNASDAVMFAYYGDADNRFNPHVSTATKKLINEVYQSGVGYSAISDNALTASQWYHAAFILGSGGVHLVLNGQRLASSLANTSSFANITPTELSIGRLGELGVYWKGYIGEVSVYNRVLTAQEILDHYNATKGMFGGGGT